MKKIFTLIILLLLTSCSSSYELSIKNNSVHETLKVNGVTNIPVSADLSNVADSNYTKNINGDTVTYDTSYSLNNYKNSKLLQCYDSYNIQTTDDRYIIRTGKNFNCFPYQYSDFDVLNYDQLEIKFKTNHKVIKHNAQKVENDTYYWYINEENLNNADIYFEIEKTVNSPYLIGLIIFMSLVVIVGIITYIIVKQKDKKNNKL